MEWLKSRLCCRVEPWSSSLTLSCSSLLSCRNEYLAIDCGGYQCRISSVKCVEADSLQKSQADIQYAENNSQEHLMAGQRLVVVS